MKLRISVVEPSIGEEELKLVSEAVRSGWVSSKGEFIEEFEEKLGKYIGTKYAIATSSGTSALHLALTALGIGHKDDVIIPTLTFASVVNAVIYTGSKPVLIDSHPEYWCINPEKIENKIGKRTKAIMPVHLYGHPCDMETIMKIAKDHNLYVIEDCAEAHGAQYKGEKTGSVGDIACFSFYGNKIITTGEGGMCLTNDEGLAEKMRILRDHGMRPEKRYWHEVVGFNYRMTNLQAALGVAQVKKINTFIRRKREITETYNSLLKDVEGITLPPEMPWAKNVYWLYSILIDKKEFGVSRDKLMVNLAENGVETRRFFYPIHTMPPYSKYAGGDSFDVADRLSSCGINLPSSTKLKEKELREIAQLVSFAQK